MDSLGGFYYGSRSTILSPPAEAAAFLDIILVFLLLRALFVMYIHLVVWSTNGTAASQVGAACFNLPSRYAVSFHFRRI